MLTGSCNNIVDEVISTSSSEICIKKKTFAIDFHSKAKEHFFETQ